MERAGCFGGNRKVTSGAIYYQPLGVDARQQSGLFGNGVTRSHLAIGVLGDSIVGQGRLCFNLWCSLVALSLLFFLALSLWSLLAQSLSLRFLVGNS